MPIINGRRLVSAVLLTVIFLMAAGFIAAQEMEYGIEDRGSWEEVKGSEVGANSEIWVENPLPVRLETSIFNLEYAVEMNEVEVARGRKERVSIAADQRSTVKLPSRIKTERLPAAWRSHLENGEETRIKVPVKLEVAHLPLDFREVVYTDTVETDLISDINRGLAEIEGNYSRDIKGVGETRIELEDVSASWGEVTQEDTNLLVSAKIHNPNSYPVPAPRLDGNLTANTVEIVKLGPKSEIVESPENGVIPPEDTRKINYRVEIDNSRIDEWFRSHVRKEEKTTARMNLQFGFDVAGRTFYLPRKGMKCTADIRTGLLVDGQDTGYSGKGCKVPDAPRNDSGKHDVPAVESIGVDHKLPERNISGSNREKLKAWAENQSLEEWLTEPAGAAVSR